MIGRYVWCVPFFLCAAQGVLGADDAQESAEKFSRDIDDAVLYATKNAEGLAALLEKGKREQRDIASMLNRNSGLTSFLIYVATVGSRAKCEVLLNYGANVNIRDASTISRRTPLIVVSGKDNQDAYAKAQLFIERRADVNAMSGQDETALSRLVDRAPQRAEHLRLLLDSRADVNRGNPLPLVCAAKRSQTDIMRLLMGAGAIVVHDQMHDDLHAIMNSTQDDECRELLRRFLAGEPVEPMSDKARTVEDALYETFNEIDPDLRQKPYRIVCGYCDTPALRWHPGMAFVFDEKLTEVHADDDTVSDEQDSKDESGGIGDDSEEDDNDEYELTLTSGGKLYPVSQLALPLVQDPEPMLI